MPDGAGSEAVRRAPRVLIVDDEPANLDLLRLTLEGEGYRVHAALDGARALAVAARNPPDLVLLDVRMPGMDGFEVCRALKQDPATRHSAVLFITAHDELDVRLEAFRAGAVDYVLKPFQDQEVRARVRAQLEIVRLRSEVEHRNAELERRLAELEVARDARERADARAERLVRREAERWGIEGLVGRSAAMEPVVREVQRVRSARSVSVLITGESGTGKELVARALHVGSERAEGPFVPVNCSAIPRDLAESVLFGHVEGAYSGATTDRAGHFVSADGGTLFLDELGDMPIELQPKLLRALEEGCVRPVGSDRTVAVDVRVVAATNSDPAERMAAGELRQDLYFRIARLTVALPPLREREGDVALLAEHFLDRLAGEMGRPRPRLGPRALAALESYEFPGNVRELRNMIERALLRCGEILLPEDLTFLNAPPARRAPAGGGVPSQGPEPAPPPSPAPEDVVLAEARLRGQIANSDVRRVLGVGRRRATRLLNGLVREGRLARTGERRWVRYSLP